MWNSPPLPGSIVEIKNVKYLHSTVPENSNLVLLKLSLLSKNICCFINLCIRGISCPVSLLNFSSSQPLQFFPSLSGLTQHLMIYLIACHLAISHGSGK